MGIVRHLLQIRRLAVLSMMLLLMESAMAQQLVLPVSSDKEASMAVAIDSVRLTMQADHTVGLDMRVCLIGRLPKDQQLVVEPRLSADGAAVSFPAMAIYGRWAYYHCVRGGNAESPLSELQLRDSEVRTPCPYWQAVAWQPWMSQATLTIDVVRRDGCGNQLAHEVRSAVEPELVLQHKQENGWTDVQSQAVRGTAYVVFPVNRTEVRTDYRNNLHELDRLCHVIDSMRLSDNVQLNHVSIKGYASPEGSYANNERLARERTNSLCQYVASHCGLSTDLISMDYVAEDWQGLRLHVARSDRKERAAILQLIDSSMEPDAKLAAIAQRHPAAYQWMSDEVFPLLRHTDYEIDYTQRSVTEHRGRVVTDSLRHLAFDTVATVVPQLEQRIAAYRPVAALKTNLLYDLALAPNIEAEITLGRNARWSLMAEYTNPWWRWSYLDESYEIQEAGLELRRWFSPRCDGGRPWLCGHFFGVYAAGARYDLERHQVGDQGDVFSCGLTYGHCWPLSRHWNIEASLSAGIIAGERRHYTAEFGSTHLIYKYTKNLFYAGPTKLKLSLVWLIGKKGGGL